MKVRTGFVSNSSTSSFCIYGTKVDCGAIKERHEEEDFDAYEYLESRASDLGLEFHSICGYHYYVGESWSSIGDDETGAQFKQRIKELVQKFLETSDDIEISTIEEAWHD